jgi:hypothetical protein
LIIWIILSRCQGSDFGGRRSWPQFLTPEILALSLRRSIHDDTRSRLPESPHRRPSSDDEPLAGVDVRRLRGVLALVKNLPDIDTRTVREAEVVCNSLIGFNFGDGHLHNEDLIAAVQDEAQFAPGELVVVWIESQAIPVSKVQHYKVVDAALGVIERGTWKVTDAVNEQPWLPNGPIPLQVTWTRPVTDGRFGAVA